MSLLAAILASVQITAYQPNHAPIKVDVPPIREEWFQKIAAPSKSLSETLLEDADAKYKNNPGNPTAVIPLYNRVIAEKNEHSQKAVEALGALFFDQIIKRKNQDKYINHAAIENYALWALTGNPYGGRAALNLGLVYLAQPGKKRESKAFSFLRKSYKVAKENQDNELELGASWAIARFGIEYQDKQNKPIGKSEVRKHANNVVRLGTKMGEKEIVKEARELLNKL
jgi:hypothetical protein